MRINLDDIPLQQQSAMLKNILLAFEHESFSKEVAIRCVGGLKKLEQLIASEEILADKTNETRQNGKWFCCAPQVLVHCKMRV